jgi:hypothetical protein
MSVVSRIIPVAALAGVFLGASLLPAAAEDKPEALGSAKSWSAYTRTTADGKVCYALSKPTASEPKKAKRDPIFILINDWPSRKVIGEIQLVPGYAYKDGEPVTVTVGSLNVEFFSKTDGGAGSAWVKDAKDEAKLLDAMRKGSKLVVNGVSKRGTKTTDTYSLAGFGDVIDKAHQACKK